MKEAMTLGSLFDGIGGFPLAGIYAGMRPVWACEIEPFPIRVVTKRMPEMLFLVFALCFPFATPRYRRISDPARLMMLVIVLFALLYAAAQNIHYELSFPKLVVIASFPCLFYLGSKWSREFENSVKSILVVMAGTGLHCLLNFAKNFSAVMSGSARNTIDFWLNSEWVITGQISLFILLAGAAYFLLFGIKLKMNVDARGSFTELLKTASCGQFSVNISKPGITKGEHWHHSKWEFFIVVSGHGLIQERKIGSDKVLNFEVSGDKIEAIHMLPGYTHNIVNLSESENLVTVMWANEQFDPGHPDTFSEKVVK